MDNLIRELYSDSIEKLSEKLGCDLPSPYPVVIFNSHPKKYCFDGVCQKELTCGFYNPDNDLIGLNNFCYDSFKKPGEFGIHEYVHKIQGYKGLYNLLPDNYYATMFFESLDNNLLDEIGIKPSSYPFETYIGKISLELNNTKASDLFKDQSKVRSVYETFENIYKEFNGVCKGMLLNKYNKK